MRGSWTQDEIQEIWLKHKRCFYCGVAKHWKKGCLGQLGWARQPPVVPSKLHKASLLFWSRSPLLQPILPTHFCTLLGTPPCTELPMNTHEFIQVIASENIPSCKGPTRMIKSNSWLCTEPPKKQPPQL